METDKGRSTRPVKACGLIQVQAKREIIRAAKRFAIDHDTTLTAVVSAALERYVTATSTVRRGA